MSCKRVQDIIRRQFSVDIEKKQNELEEVEERLTEVRVLLDRLRAVVIAQYYGAGTSNFGELHDEGLVRTSSRRRKADVQSEDKTSEVDIGKSSHSVESPRSVAAETSSTASSSGRQSPVIDGLVISSPYHNASTRVHSQVSRASCLYIKKRVIIGNTSRFIPDEEREAGDQSTHKWMVYVRGVSEEPSVYHFVSSVTFFLHPSYKPNDLVTIINPPFHLTRRGWGEFPVRVQLHLRDGKKVDAIHNLKLDKTYSGLQTRGSETTVEVQVERHCVDPVSSLETSRITTAVPSPFSDVNNQGSDDSSSEDEFIMTTMDANKKTLDLNDLVYYLPLSTQKAAKNVMFDHSYVSSNAISLTGLLPIDPETYLKNDQCISLRSSGSHRRQRRRCSMLSVAHYPVPQTRDILRSMLSTVKVFPTPEHCLTACIKSFPLIHPSAAQLYPYAAVTSSQFDHWSVSRQRAAEWMRGVALQKAMRSFFPSVPGNKLPSTFEVVRWCRDNGHTPQSVYSVAQKSGRGLCRVCGCPLETCANELNSPKWIHSECSKEWCKRGKVSVSSLSRARETLKCQVPLSEAAECSESMEIDICGETLDDTPSKKYVVREEMPADVQWVYDEAKKVGVNLATVDHDGISLPTVEKMVLAACFSLVQDIVAGSVQQAALSGPTTRASHSKVAVPSKTWSSSRRPYHSRSLSEPAYYTSYLCCPRQDIPGSVLIDPPACDEVFDKVGRNRVLPRLAGKVDTPLTTLEYNSLHDPHLKHLYLCNKSMRKHLTESGLVTGEMRVIGSPQEYRQHVRAHEILERKEHLQRKLEEREISRISKLKTYQPKLPKLVLLGMVRAETRRACTHERRQRQTEIEYQRQQDSLKEQEMQEAAKKQALLARQNAEQFEEERRQEEQRRQEQELFGVRYNDKFEDLPNGLEIAAWHREKDILEHRIQVMEYLYWGQHGEGDLKDTDLLGYLESIKWNQRAKETLDMSKRKLEEATVEQEVAEVEAKRQEVNKDLNDVKVELEMEMDTLEQEEEKQEIQHEEDEDVDGKPQVVDTEMDPFHGLVMELFGSMDEAGSGFLTVNSFRAVLNSRVLDLQPSDDELQFMISQASQTADGLVAYQEVIPIMKDILIEIFKERAEVGMERRESSWKLLYSPSSGYIYFHKETGEVKQRRPSDYIPPFRDEFFWDTMFDIFNTADINQDGVLDREEFFLLLQSQNVGLRLFEEQRTQLLELFDSMGVAAVSFEDFIPLARIVIMMVYQNHYDSKTPWVELNSPQYGPFWYNRFTGEVLLNPPGDVNDEALQEVVTEELEVAGQSAVLPVPPQDSSRSAKSSVTRSLAGTLPPIEEVTDRDTLVGTPESVAFMNRSPSLDIMRPQSPLPPESTPEIDNRQRTVSYRDIPDSPENTVVSRDSERGREKRRHRPKRTRSKNKRSSSLEGGPREQRSRGHSRQRRQKQREKPVVEDKSNVVVKTTEQAKDKSETVQVPVQEDEQEAVQVTDKIEAEPLEPIHASELGKVSEEAEEVNHNKPDGNVTNTTSRPEVEKIGQEIKQDSHEANPPCRSQMTDDNVTTANSASTKLSKPNPVEDIKLQSPAGDETAAAIKSNMLTTSTLSVLVSDKPEDKTTEVTRQCKGQLETATENHQKYLIDTGPDNTQTVQTKSDPVVNKLNLADDDDDQQYPADTGPDSTHTLQTNSEPAVNKPNLADDDKISLGVASNSSLPKPSISRVGSARSRLGSASRSRVGSASTSRATVGQVSPSSSAQHSSEALLKQSPTASLPGLKSQSQASRTKMSQEGGNGSVSVEDQPLTDQEKLASRRSSLIEV